MNAQTLDGSSLTAPTSDDAAGGVREADLQLAPDPWTEHPAADAPSRWRIAIGIVIVLAGALLAFSLMQKRHTDNALFAPATVPVAVADAQVAANKAKAAAAAARKSAAAAVRAKMTTGVAPSPTESPSTPAEPHNSSSSRP